MGESGQMVSEKVKWAKSGSQPTLKLDDPGPLPPKLVFLDHFFGENVLFHQFDPTNTPKCYTWLESYGSSLRDGKNKKNIFSSCEASDFRWRSQTDFLHDLEARLMSLFQQSQKEFSSLAVFEAPFKADRHCHRPWKYSNTPRHRSLQNWDSPNFLLWKPQWSAGFQKTGIDCLVPILRRNLHIEQCLGGVSQEAR